MRVAYDNIIDDLNASTLTALSTATGYSILDVQDQRLTTVWKSGSATSQTVLAELDTFPEYPDASAGTVLFTEFSGSAYSFVATGGTIDYTTYNGILRLTASTAGSYIRKASGVALASGQTLITKLRSPNALSTTVSILVGASVVSTITGIGTEFALFSSLIVGGASATTLTILGTNTASAGTVFDVDGLYFGNGNYTYQLEDQSGNGNNGTVVGATPVDTPAGRGLIGDGVNDIVRLSASLNIPGAFTWSLWFKSTVGGYVMTKDSGGGSRGPSIFVNTNPDFRISVDGTTQFITTCIGLNALDGNWHLITGVYTPSVSVDIYFDGVLNIHNTTSIPASQFASSGTLNLLGRDGSVSYYTGDIADPRIYNRALADWEIEKLYNQESWVGEYDGLAGWWPVDYGLGVNIAAVLGHNLLTGNNLRIQANNSNDWGDPELDEQITINPNLSLKFLDDTYYYKYWRFTFGAQGDLEIGRLWLGEYLTIDPSSLLDFKVAKKRSDNVIHGKNRQKWASIGVGWREFNITFPPTEEAMIYELSKMYDEVGNHSSFIFCNFDQIRSYQLVEPCYVSFNGAIGFDHTDRMKFAYSLNMEEEM